MLAIGEIQFLKTVETVTGNGRGDKREWWKG
jgi:hypothetical protein